MPFICESITNHPLYKKSGCILIPEFIKIRPLSCPTPIENKSKLVSCFMASKYRDYATEIQNLEVYNDDIWLIAFPKTGSVWLQEMLWLICNDFNYDKSYEKPINERAHLLEYFALFPHTIIKENTIIKTRRATSPRLITSHLPVSLLPTKLWKVKPRIIYLTRNPKDTAISYYYHYKLLGYQGNLSEFLDLFMENMVMNAPFHSHVTEFWNMRNNENVMFITYEDMHNNLTDIITKITNFLEKEINSEQLLTLEKHLSFESMKSNASVNFKEEITKISAVTKAKENNIEFFRSGKIGTYHENMPHEYVEKFDKWTDEQLKDSDFKFKY